MAIDIVKVSNDIVKCEDEIKIAETNVLQSTGDDKKYWIMKEKALRAEKNVLRAKENVLRAEKNVLRAEKIALMAEKKPKNEASIPKYSKGI